MIYRLPLSQIPWSIALLALPAKIVGTFIDLWHIKVIRYILTGLGIFIGILLLALLVTEMTSLLAGDKTLTGIFLQWLRS